MDATTTTSIMNNNDNNNDNNNNNNNNNSEEPTTDRRKVDATDEETLMTSSPASVESTSVVPGLHDDSIIISKDKCPVTYVYCICGFFLSILILCLAIWFFFSSK
jgi:hypothetical protein